MISGGRAEGDGAVAAPHGAPAAYSGPERRRAGRERAAAEMAALSEAAAGMVDAETVEQVTAIAVRTAVSSVGADGGTVALRDGDVLHLISTEGYNPELRTGHAQLELAAALPVCHVARTGERLLLPTRRDATDRFPAVAAHQELTDRAGVPIVSAAVLPLRAGGELLGSLTVTWAVERTFPAGDVQLLEALSALVARAVDRVRSSAVRDQALGRADLLARSWELLTAGMDRQAVLDALGGLVVPALGRGLVVELAPVGGTPAQVVRFGEVGSAEAPGSTCAAPLALGGRRLGRVAACRGVEEPYGTQERELLRAVADRAALALDNALVFTEQRETSLALQQALLTEPPELTDLSLGVRYQPASHASVGGDWYDAVVTPRGATVLVVGDVVGHDARAAASMGQLRGLLRAAAYLSEDAPAALLRRTDAAAVGLDVAALATVVVATLEPPGPPGTVRELRWSSAGHLPPALVRADGTVALLESDPDLLLGVDVATPRTEHRTTLADGDTLLLYTDGLVERRGASIEDGLQQLVQHLTQLGALPPDVLCDALLARLLRDGAEDDVALLAVRVTPEDARRQPRRGAHGRA